MSKFIHMIDSRSASYVSLAKALDDDEKYSTSRKLSELATEFLKQLDAVERMSISDSVTNNKFIHAASAIMVVAQSNNIAKDVNKRISKLLFYKLIRNKHVAASRDAVVENIMAGVLEVLNEVENTGDNIQYCRILNVAVSIASKLKQYGSAAGAALLEILRRWQAVGIIDDDWLNQRRAIALLRYIGVDNGYMDRYNKARVWAWGHPDNASSAKDYYYVALPLIEVFIKGGRLEDASKIYADLVKLPVLADVQKQYLRSENANYLREALSSNNLDVDSIVKHADYLRSLLPDSEQQYVDALACELKYIDVLNRIMRDKHISSKTFDNIVDGLPKSSLIDVQKRSQICWMIEKSLGNLAETYNPKMNDHARITLMSRIESLMQIYFKLEPNDLSAPLHTSVLQNLMKLAPVVPSILKHIENIGIDKLREEDYQRWTNPTNGRTYPSLAEKMVKVIYSDLKNKFIRRSKKVAIFEL